MARALSISNAPLQLSSSASSSSRQAAQAAFCKFPKRFALVTKPREREDAIASSRRRGKLIRAGAQSPQPPAERPLVGNHAPNFEAEAVFNQEFVKVKLSNYVGKKFVVLFFYPLNFTFVCPSELTAFSDRYSEFKKHDCEVLAVSTDSVFSHLAWIQTDRKSGGLGELNYPVVSDLTKAITKAYHVLIPEQGIGLRGLFIIDKEGIIQHCTINNLAIGRSVEECLRLVQAIQHVKAHPDEVCPAGWQPGDDGLKPDPKHFAPV